MVGNVWEMVSDPMQGNLFPWNPTTNPSSKTVGQNAGNPGILLGDLYGSDAMYGVNPASNQIPDGNFYHSIIIRGGHWSDKEQAGIFATDACSSPMQAELMYGFRCAVPGRI